MATEDPVKSPAPLFSQRSPAPAPRSPLPWLVAAVLVLFVAGALFAFGRRRSEGGGANVQQPAAPYATQMSFDHIVMSESSSLSGGKSTFIDGEVHNNGPSRLTAATVQVIFANDEATPPQVETTPLTLIRTREPYIDTQPLNAAPLAPGETREFRLIFEDIAPNWNQQLPRVVLTQANLK